MEGFPDENLPNRLFNGVRYSELPICNIKTSPNNTIITMADSAGNTYIIMLIIICKRFNFFFLKYKGLVRMINSCGIEGFKNTKKGTNIASQATAITLATVRCSVYTI